MAKHWTRGMMAVLVGVSLLAGAGAAVAQDAQTKALLEKYRADFNAAKKETINEVMKLNDAEAQKFWPIYERAEKLDVPLGDPAMGGHCGFAFGLGIERVAILKYAIPDMRVLLDADVRFLEQFEGVA